MTPQSPVHGHCQECTLSLTQSDGRSFLLPKPWLHLGTGGSSLTLVKGESLGFGSSGGDTGCLVQKGSGSVLYWSQFVPSLSIMDGIPRPSPGQRGPSPAAPTTKATKATFQKLPHSVELRKGSTPGAGNSGEDTWGHKRGLGSGERGGDVRMPERRHRKGCSSRYRRRYVEQDRA